MALPFIDKIDPTPICAQHWATLVDDNTGATRPRDVVLFYGVPAVLAVALAWYGVRLSDSALGILTNALALLAGLLFNLLVLLHGLVWPPKDHPMQQTAQRLGSHVYANIAYSILISLVALLPLAVASNYERGQSGRSVAGLIAVALVSHFGLTMFMVLKRMTTMLRAEFDGRLGSR